MKRFPLVFTVTIFFGMSRFLPAQTPPTLTDFWNTNATWVADSNNIGQSFAFHFPSIIADGPDLWAYYINNHTGAGGASKSAIGRARSRDGINWTNDGIVLDVSDGSGWDNRLASFPGIWKDGDTWYLVYEGAAEDIAFSPGDIGLATSTDGKHFTKHPRNPILRHNSTGWEKTNIGTPSLYKENETWYLFYHGYDGDFCRIGVATGTSLTMLVKHAGNPIIDVAPGDSAWDCGTAGRRSAIVKEGRYYYLAYEGSTRRPFTQARWSSGLARSTNLFDWTNFPANPVIPQTTAGFGFDGPELLRISNVWFMYVRTGDESAPTKRFRLVVSPPARR